MPKIRTKQIYKLINGNFIKKSGSLTRSLKNIIKKENRFKAFFEENFYHNRDGISLSTLPYNDDNTVDFVEKNVNNAFPVEDKYKLNNKILHTPNEFDTSDKKIKKIVTSNQYDMFLRENYIQETTSLFNDSAIANKEDLKNNKKEIRISLDFLEPCRLSFNKDNSSSQTVSFNSESYNCLNSPVVYYNFNERKWDYLGDVQKNYFESINEFSNAPIAFNSINPIKSNKIKNQTIGYPINTFGFPFDDRFQGLDKHLLKLNRYIKKPFLLEGIKIRFKGTSRAETESNFNFYILNSLNFFILNQRKNLNKSSFSNLDLTSGNYDYFIIGEGYQQNSNSLTYSVDNFPEYTDIDKTNTIGENYTILNSSNLNPTYTESSSSQRELISYLNIVNFSSGGIDDSTINIDIDNIRKNADFIHEDLSQSNDSTIFANCNYSDKVIEVTGNIRTPIYHDKHESFSNFNIYPYSTYSNRTGTEYNTERSDKSDYSEKVNELTSIDDAGTSLTISRDSSKENKYLLLPTDEILIGFSFNPSMRLSNNNKSGKDIYILKDNVEVSLIGSYYQKEEKVKTSKVTFKNNNFKKINYFESINNTNTVGMNNIYLNKGAYYDLKISKSTVLTNGQNFTLTLNNVNSGAFFESSNNLTIAARTFTNFKKVSDENEENLDTLVGGNKDYTNQYLSYFKFGNPSNRLNYNRFTSFKDLALNKSYYTVIKKFRDSSFNEITSTKSYNSNKYSILDVTFKE